MRRWLAVMLALTVLMGPTAAVRATGQRERPGEWRVLWIPLDSRPVNTREVQLFGEAVGATVRLPPAAMLDWYASRRADSAKLLNWWRTTAKRGETVVFATNSLLMGGLIASRDPALYQGLERRLEALADALKRLPRGRRIAVHILPRAWPTQFRPDGSPGPDHAYTAPLLERTELQHRLLLFGRPADRTRLGAVERLIPADARARQDALIAHNRRIVATLLKWAAAGLVDEVIVGLDDARPFGLANQLHRQLEADLRARGLAGRVHPAYGADEISFLLLAREALQRKGMQPRIAVEYDTPEAESLLLPYEGASLGRSVGQKLAFLGAQPASGKRGQRLFLHTARAETASRRLLERMAAAYRSGEGIALADVTGTGERNRALVERVGLHLPLKELAYAGWNTASNAAGTALAMAAVRDLHTRSDVSERERQALAAFQAVRYAHDLIYQAHRERLTAWARQRRINPDSFGPDREAMTRHLRATVLPEARAWLDRWYRGPATVTDAAFPWDRTFEATFRPAVADGASGRRP